MHEVASDPPTPMTVPEAFAAQGGTASYAERWWTVFSDPVLDELVTLALGENLSLKRAWARLAQARALAVQAGSARWPQLSADLGVSGARTNLSLPTGDQSQTNAQYSLGVGVAYEIDLWGKMSAQERAAEADLNATQRDVEATAMSLVAQITESWFSLVEQRALRALVNSQLEINSTYLELVELRFRQGFASALDVYQQRQQLTKARAQLPLIDGRIASLNHQLAALLGMTPARFQPAAGLRLPQVPPLPDVGVPSALLARRPDVAAAARRIAAADHRVGVAIADRFPSLQLTGSTGFKASDLTEFFSNWIWGLASKLTAVIFDGGRRAAEVARTRAQLEELVIVYGETVVTAIKEVEDALVQERQQKRYVEELQRQLLMARATLNEAKARYLQGLNDYLPVLTALQAVHQAEQMRLQAQRQRLGYRVHLYRALGGTWTRELRPTTPKAAHSKPPAKEVAP